MSPWLLFHYFCKFYQKVIRYTAQFQIIAGFYTMTITVMGNICIIVLGIDFLPDLLFSLVLGNHD